MSVDRGERLDVAVVGSGISGLACAWLLAQRHKVTLYERETRPGGHTNTIEVPCEMSPAPRSPIDTGFIVYNEATYPNLVALFAHLGVATQPSEMSFAVSLDDGALEYGGTDLSTLFAQRRNLVRPRFLLMLRDLLRFYREAPAPARRGRARRPEPRRPASHVTATAAPSATTTCCRWRPPSGRRRARPCSTFRP